MEGFLDHPYCNSIIEDSIQSGRNDLIYDFVKGIIKRDGPKLLEGFQINNFGNQIYEIGIDGSKRLS